MHGLTINVNDEASPLVARVEAAMRDRLKPLFGRTVSETLRDHLFELNSSRPNQLGGKRTNFYTAAGRSVHYTVNADDVRVSINSPGIAQRYFGGTITPKTAKLLTIPADASAYGKRAREFSNLHAIFFRGGPAVGALVTKDNQVMYWLKASVTQKPDPTVLPTREAMIEPAFDACRDLLDRAAKRGGSTK